MCLAPSAASRRLRSVIMNLFRPNFYRLHMLYFILVIILASVIFYGSSTSEFPLAYIDAIFLCTSAMCNIGLKSVNLGSLTGFQQSTLFILMIMGDLTIVTISVVIVRRYYFSKKIRRLLDESQTGRQIALDIQRRNPDKENQPESSNRFQTGDPSPPLSERLPTHLSGYGLLPAQWGLRRILKYLGRFKQDMNDFIAEHHYLSFRPMLDEKGRLTALSPEQERELGGVEYRALRVLTFILFGYFAFWQFVTLVVLIPYATNTNVRNVIRETQPGNLEPAWWSIFATISAYSNTGLDLLNMSMAVFANDYLILVFIGTAILAGVSVYRTGQLHHSLTFLLHHPRRCYILLFPSTSTWFLFGTQISINLSAWFFWIVLGIRHPPIPDVSTGQSVMDGLFQAHALRSAGFNVTNIGSISPALQFLYLIIVYTAVFPVIMSLRQSNVYEERSLGQTNDSKFGNRETGHKTHQSQLGVHIRNQLAYDIWYLCLCIFLISIIEYGHLITPDPGFSLFSVIFEVVTAYGTVGISLGIPGSSLSFSGAWHVLSKLVLVTVMIRGRHRILPMAIDRAVLLPGQEMMDKLDHDYRGGPLSIPNWRELEEMIREQQSGGQEEEESQARESE